MKYFKLTVYFQRTMSRIEPEKLEKTKYYEGDRELTMQEVITLFYKEKKFVGNASSYTLTGRDVEGVSIEEYEKVRALDKLNYFTPK